MNKPKRKYLNSSRSNNTISNKDSFIRNKKKILKLDTNKALLINGYIRIKCPKCDEYFEQCIYLDYNLYKETIICEHCLAEFSLKLDIANSKFFNSKIEVKFSEKE